MFTFAPGVCPAPLGPMVSDYEAVLKADLQPSSSSRSTRFAGQTPQDDKSHFVPAPSIFRKLICSLSDRETPCKLSFFPRSMTILQEAVRFTGP